MGEGCVGLRHSRGSMSTFPQRRSVSAVLRFFHALRPFIGSVFYKTFPVIAVYRAIFNDFAPWSYLGTATLKPSLIEWFCGLGGFFHRERRAGHGVGQRQC